LIDVPKWTEAQAVRSRMFTQDMGMMSMGMGGMGRMGGMMGINGRSMDMACIDGRVPLGSIEFRRSRIRRRWPIASTSTTSNSVCSTATVSRRWRMRTRSRIRVLVDSGSAVRVIAAFANFADPQHPYMYYCHILEHEDTGMTGQFVVVCRVFFGAIRCLTGVKAGPPIQWSGPLARCAAAVAAGASPFA
jgi:blue copper oxidase